MLHERRRFWPPRPARTCAAHEPYPELDKAHYLERRVIRRAVQFGELLRELELELRRVDPLRLGHEDASPEHLELEPEPLVRGTQLLTLDDELRHERLRCSKRRALGDERSFERGDSPFGSCTRHGLHPGQLPSDSRSICR
ncbi:MAG TPA: hypothetical protein VHC69_02400 [Polyangiaceae bacterium]|nr:hypothetical protein [Polyangiaceae bacterium]